MIERPADCEIWSVIRFLNARNVKPAVFIVRYVKYTVRMPWVME
jgi:hypothetical protein